MKEVIIKLMKKYKTNDPFEIVKSMGGIILFGDIGECNGFCITPRRQIVVYINNKRPKHLQKLTMAHELGHIVLHRGLNTNFLHCHTNLVVNKFEREANEFAVNLLISDEELSEYTSYTLQQLSMIFGYPEEIIKLRLK